MLGDFPAKDLRPPDSLTDVLLCPEVSTPAGIEFLLRFSVAFVFLGASALFRGAVLFVWRAVWTWASPGPCPGSGSGSGSGTAPFVPIVSQLFNTEPSCASLIALLYFATVMLSRLHFFDTTVGVGVVSVGLSLPLAGVPPCRPRTPFPMIFALPFFLLCLVYACVSVLLLSTYYRL